MRTLILFLSEQSLKHFQPENLNLNNYTLNSAYIRLYQLQKCVLIIGWRPYHSHNLYLFDLSILSVSAAISHSHLSHNLERSSLGKASQAWFISNYYTSSTKQRFMCTRWYIQLLYLGFNGAMN